MDSRQYGQLLPRLRAFVSGDASDDERAHVEALIDEDPEARALVGVLAREREQMPARASRDPFIGLTLGERYVLRRAIGQGGMGMVYEAEHRLLGRQVALKLLRPEASQEPAIRRRFENEARAAASLNHPNIVQALDVGRAQGMAYVVYELLEGDDLQKRLAAGPLGVDEAVAITRSIAGALEFAHGRGIVHRDIKPANIVMVGDVPKLVDFGISKVAEHTATRSGVFMGTPAYMAPEQVRSARDVDGRADLYSLGVMLFQLCTGSLPFESPALSPRALPAVGEALLDEVIARCTAFDVSARYENAAALIRALDRWRGASSVLPLADGTRRMVLTVLSSSGRETFGQGSWSDAVVRAAWRAAERRAVDDRVALIGRSYLCGERYEDDERLQEALEHAHAGALRGVLASHAVCPLLAKRARPTFLREFALLEDDELDETPFVGRASELAFFRASIAALESRDEGELVQLVGAPGMGKTRLLQEVQRLALSLGCEPIALRGSEVRSLFGAAGVQTDGDAREMQRRADAQRADFLDEVRATNGSVVILVDEAHDLADAERRFLVHLAEERRVLVVLATQQADPVPRAHQMSLRGLSRSETQRLVQSFSGSQSDEDALDELVRDSEGNPLFIEQLLQAGYLDAGVRAELPAGIQGAIQGQMDALEASEQEVLRLASIFGEGAFLFAWLRAFGVSEEALGASLRRGGFLRREPEEGTYRIASRLLSDVINTSLTPEDRTSLSATMARYLARHDEVPPATVARLFDQAGQDLEAGEWFGRASMAAYRRGDFGRAMEWASMAFARGAQDGALASALAEMYELAGRFDEERVALANAERWTAGEDGAVLAARRAVSWFRAGEWARAREGFEAAIARAESPAARALCHGKYAVALAYRGELDDAIAQRNHMERHVSLHAPELRAEACQWRGQVSVCLGDLGDQRHAYWATHELYLERGDVRRAAEAGVNLADSYNRLGAYEEAARALEACLEECRDLDAFHGRDYARVNLAYAYTHLRRFDDAERALRRADEGAARDERLGGLHRLYDLRLRAARGVWAEADEARALELRVSPTIRALALALLARQLNGERALVYAQEAAAIVAEGALEEDTARVWWAQMDALQRAGRRDEAQQVRAMASAALLAQSRRIGDGSWREHFLRSVPAHRALLGRGMVD